MTTTAQDPKPNPPQSERAYEALARRIDEAADMVGEWSAEDERNEDLGPFYAARLVPRYLVLRGASESLRHVARLLRVLVR